jgi:hypothetical protein
VVPSTSHEDSGVPALALAPCLIDTVGGADTRTLEHELLDRATQPYYRAWLAGVGIANGCTRPIRLRGTIRVINPATGEIVRMLDTQSLPDGVLYIPCGDRRSSVCPACSETYRRDAYQLIRAGLTGGKGVPETISAHPCVFATFTAPSLGPGPHSQREPRRPDSPLSASPQEHHVPARAADVLRPDARGNRHLPWSAAVCRLLRLRRCCGLERARA